MLPTWCIAPLDTVVNPSRRKSHNLVEIRSKNYVYGPLSTRALIFGPAATHFDLMSYSTHRGDRPDPDTLIPDTHHCDLINEYHRLSPRALKFSDQGSA
jgi:hypothetical protein